VFSTLIWSQCDQAEAPTSVQKSSKTRLSWIQIKLYLRQVSCKKSSNGWPHKKEVRSSSVVCTFRNVSPENFIPDKCKKIHTCGTSHHTNGIRYSESRDTASNALGPGLLYDLRRKIGTHIWRKTKVDIRTFIGLSGTNLKRGSPGFADQQIGSYRLVLRTRIKEGLRAWCFQPLS